MTIIITKAIVATSNNDLLPVQGGDEIILPPLPPLNEVTAGVGAEAEAGAEAVEAKNVFIEGSMVTFGETIGSGARCFKFANLKIMPLERPVLIEISTKTKYRSKPSIWKREIYNEINLFQCKCFSDIEILLMLGEEILNKSGSITEGTVKIVKGSCIVEKKEDFMYDG
jgi:hypothetical protein